MKRNSIYGLLLLVFLLASCGGGYNKILKSDDNEFKYQKAREYYEKKSYLRAVSLLECVAPYFRNTKQAHEILYLTAKSYEGQKNYFLAGSYFSTYAKQFPRESHAVESRFKVGYCYYLDSPDAKLDQTSTYKAIEALQSFLDVYPNTEYSAEALRYLDEMYEKLANKELINAQLYYNLGIYLGNNYRAAVITAENAIKKYPNSKFREDFVMIILRSKYKQAEISVLNKQEERYSETIDEYYNYIGQYPEGKYEKEAKRIFDIASRYVQENKNSIY